MKRPDRDETLRLYVPDVPLAIDPTLPLTLTQALLLENCADRLVELNVTGEVRHNLLETSAVSNDGLRVRLTIQKGVLFHDGTEMTADDVIHTLATALRSRRVADLHQLIATDTSEQHGFALRRTSRYRVEVRLRRKVVDLLQRLSVPALSVRSQATGATSGPWRKVSHTEDGLELARHTTHELASQGHYQRVILSPFSREDDFNHHLAEHAYAFIYPGLSLKSPAKETLIGEMCRPLTAGISYLVRLRSDLPDKAAVKALIDHMCHKVQARAAHWPKRGLNGLFPQQHSLHMPFAFERAPALRGPVRLRLAFRPATLSPRFLEQLTRAAAGFALEITFVEIAVDAVSLSAGGFDGLVEEIFVHHPADVFTSLDQWPPGQGSPRDPLRLRDWCRSFLQNYDYAPLFFSPIMVRTNRGLAPALDSGLVRFGQFRASHELRRFEKAQDDTLKAIGAAVQMFAHDVKKPFSMIQGMIALMESTDDPVRLKDLVSRHLPQIKRSIRSANLMIQDIADIGSDAEPFREATSTKELIDAVLKELSALPGDGLVHFRYEWQHSRQATVDSHKLLRVVNNILANAIQAMGGNGTIWFRTIEHGDWLTLTIGNSGSFIPADQREELFDRFFTRGKRQGTGLGLAIVKKIVMDHGGRVWCTSDVERGTEFHLTLPLGPERDNFDGPSYANTSDDFTPPVDAGSAIVRSELRIAVVDDDPLFLETWETLGGFAAVTTFVTPAEFFSACHASSNFLAELDAIVLDFRFHNAMETGADVAATLRAEGCKKPIFLASDRPAGMTLEAAFTAAVPKDAVLAARLIRNLIG